MATGSNGGGGSGAGGPPAQHEALAGGIPTSPMDEAFFFEKPIVNYFSLTVSAAGAKATQLTEWNVRRIALLISIAGNNAVQNTLNISPDPTLIAAAAAASQKGLTLTSTNLPFAITQSGFGLLTQVEWFGLIPVGNTTGVVTVIEQRLLRWPEVREKTNGKLSEVDYRAIIQDLLRHTGNGNGSRVSVGIGETCRAYSLGTDGWQCDDKQ